MGFPRNFACESDTHITRDLGIQGGYRGIHKTRQPYWKRIHISRGYTYHCDSAHDGLPNKFLLCYGPSWRVRVTNVTKEAQRMHNLTQPILPFGRRVHSMGIQTSVMYF